jgi:hypothetical protein
LQRIDHLLEWQATPERVIDTLLSYQFGMHEAEDVLLTGCSAGGLGALLSTDSVHEQIKQKALKLNKFASAPSSGFFLAHDNLAGSVQFETNMAEAIAFGNWSMPSTECAQHLGKLQSWKCLLAQYAYDYVKAPIFILNEAMDSWQTTFIYAKPFIDGVGCCFFSLAGYNFLSGPPPRIRFKIWGSVCPAGFSRNGTRM